MKVIVIIISIFYLNVVFANKITLKENITKNKILKRINFNKPCCENELNEVFEMIINKDKHVLDKYKFAKKVSCIVFTKKYKIDLNTRIEILLALLFYQSDENVVYTFILAKHFGIHTDYYPLLLFFSSFKECPNSLLRVRTNFEFLKKLKPEHKKIINQIEQLTILINDKKKLNSITHSLISKTVSSDWYYLKYKKYYVNL